MKRSIGNLRIGWLAPAILMVSSAAITGPGRGQAAERGAAASQSTTDQTGSAHAHVMQDHEHTMTGTHDHSVGAAVPTMPGQDAFGAIQEIVHMLEADPKTDWSKVDLEALRQHLIDMNEVTLKADAVAKPIDGGLGIAVTGRDRTLAAIGRMVPAQAHMIDGLNGWSAQSTPLSNGILLTVTSTDPKQTQHIRGLGFIGILATGTHHQAHHLAMAKGEFSH